MHVFNTIHQLTSDLMAYQQTLEDTMLEEHTQKMLEHPLAKVMISMGALSRYLIRVSPDSVGELGTEQEAKESWDIVCKRELTHEEKLDCFAEAIWWFEGQEIELMEVGKHYGLDLTYWRSKTDPNPSTKELFWLNAEWRANHIYGS